ncbi:MAG: hypothetical protein WCV82_01395 [Candidatus Paceibacterota bacterium]
MNKGLIACSILAILFGAFLIVYGGYDDSPGGQLIGLIAVVAGIVGVKKPRVKSTIPMSSTEKPRNKDDR